jgi:hypothetical protein
LDVVSSFFLPMTAVIQNDVAMGQHKESAPIYAAIKLWTVRTAPISTSLPYPFDIVSASRA